MSLDGLAGYFGYRIVSGLGGAEARHDAAMIPKC